jgi:parvulin-like peptidyl-prolyl isomerase
VSHLLVDYKKRCKEDVQALAEKIRKQLLNGEDFITLAKKYSDDPSVKKNHGSLGYFSKKRMVKKFSDAAFALKKVGDISPVIETKYGLHIIRLDKKERVETIPFEKVKDVLVKDLRHKIVGNINQNFKSDLLDAENIDINLEAIKGLVTHY